MSGHATYTDSTSRDFSWHVGDSRPEIGSTMIFIFQCGYRTRIDNDRSSIFIDPAASYVLNYCFQQSLWPTVIVYHLVTISDFYFKLRFIKKPRSRSWNVIGKSINRDILKKLPWNWRNFAYQKRCNFAAKYASISLHENTKACLITSHTCDTDYTFRIDRQILIKIPNAICNVEDFQIKVLHQLSSPESIIIVCPGVRAKGFKFQSIRLLEKSMKNRWIIREVNRYKWFQQSDSCKSQKCRMK